MFGTLYCLVYRRYIPCIELVVFFFVHLVDAETEKGTDATENTSKDDELIPISKYRRALPQVLAALAKNLILLESSMTLAFPTLVIPALLKSKGRLSFNESSASWFGSILSICQMIGSFISSAVMEPLGRKNSMLIVNVPYLIGWYLYYSAISVPVLFAASVMMGLGIGFMEAPVVTYVGEISEPNLRGILTSFSGLFITVGLIVEFLLGTLCDWTTAALISSLVPLITIIAISQVPETPMWLLSKGRVKEAENSLCWLRGWVPAAYVQNELNDLIRYSNNASKLVPKEKAASKSKCKNEIANGDRRSELTTYSNRVYSDDEITDKSTEVVKCPPANEFTRCGTDVDKPCGFRLTETAVASGGERKPTTTELIRDLFRAQIIKPLSLVIALFIFYNGSGFPAVRPYMVVVFKELRFPVEAHSATVVVSCIAFLGVFACIICVKYAGKRVLTLASLVGCAIAMLSLSLWTLLNGNSTDESPRWTPFLLFIMLAFSYNIGILHVPWMMLSEVFPLRGRGFASGIATAISHIMTFCTAKTFLDMKSFFGLSGVFGLYGVITVIGIIYVYFELPETEGKSLEDIENFYKSKKYKSGIK